MFWTHQSPAVIRKTFWRDAGLYGSLANHGRRPHFLFYSFADTQFFIQLPQRLAALLFAEDMENGFIQVDQEKFFRESFLQGPEALVPSSAAIGHVSTA
ncbi:MAG: hypothetical protein ACLRSX_02745 [Akkermansia sp.]|uniref:Uncharacterized protein n=1 Tax=Akkermansia massiliensis TaxID=2927224 RepID=A0AAE6TC35_9BACT|nr:MULTISPECIES: hypothetical protein [Akkermansia]PNC22063.1 hypothetical protein CXU18_03245 [Akkermansia muciniphila]MBO1688437.1 hypothetical protein [Akkermansia sp. GGCC_0220]PNC49614.1 hypothetical protein CXU11_05405 [Akkermansia muciniphila]PNC49695.1 hypothetical protein CXU15_08785 [Akkermansia muciniphila]QHV63880.1 hypothetical protein DMI76_11135 [Akkermansia massiliensis]